MGPLSYRTYRELAGDDRSQVLAQVEAQRSRVARRLAPVRAVVGVMSGKGGVGKSWVTASLALAAAAHADADRPTRVGVLDSDLRGPTTARLLGAAGPLRVDAEGVHPAIGRAGIAVISMDLLLDEGRPLAWRAGVGERHVWRGLLEVGTLREFLGDVVWGPLDLLLVDLPPSVDALVDVAELVPDGALAGAVAVTIPSEESRRAVERAMRAAVEARVPLLGVVENMSGYACATCGATRPLFAGEAGERLAAAFGVPLLARVPFAPGAGPGAVPLPTPLLAAVLAAGKPRSREEP